MSLLLTYGLGPCTEFAVAEMTVAIEPNTVINVNMEDVKLETGVDVPDIQVKVDDLDISATVEVPKDTVAPVEICED